MKHTTPNPIIALALTAVLVAACNDNAGNSRTTAQSSALPPATKNPAPPPASSPVNQAPVISGTAPEQATVGQLWAFQPTLIDPDGDVLNISSSNLPGWMDLNKANGRLTGTPGDADVQTWSNIVLTASDGNVAVSLPAFTVKVIAQNAASGSATLSWLPPTQRTDGSPVGEISGYRLLYGQAPGGYTQSVTISNPGITSYMIEGLTSGEWFFAIQTLDGNGLFSAPSAEVSKVI